MRLHEFVYNLIDRFSPMGEMDKAELRQDAQLDYIKIKKTVQDDKKELLPGVTWKTMKVKQKIIHLSEHYITRTALALLFIGCLRWVQDFLNPPKDDYDDDEDD
jgi:hypothetical protein